MQGRKAEREHQPYTASAPTGAPLDLPVQQAIQRTRHSNPLTTIPANPHLPLGLHVQQAVEKFPVAGPHPRIGALCRHQRKVRHPAGRWAGQVDAAGWAHAAGRAAGPGSSAGTLDAQHKGPKHRMATSLQRQATATTCGAAAPSPLTCRPLLRVLQPPHSEGPLCGRPRRCRQSVGTRAQRTAPASWPQAGKRASGVTASTQNAVLAAQGISRNPRSRNPRSHSRDPRPPGAWCPGSRTQSLRPQKPPAPPPPACPCPPGQGWKTTHSRCGHQNQKQIAGSCGHRNRAPNHPPPLPPLAATVPSKQQQLAALRTVTLCSLLAS